LKAFAYQNERVENASVEFDPVTLRPTYKLSIGIPGQSNAFEIALRLGLDPAIVDRARRFVPRQEQELGRMIAELKESRYRVEVERRELSEARRQLEEQQRRLSQERELFLEEKRNIIEETRRKADSYLVRVRREADDALEEIKAKLKEKTPPKWHELERSRRKLRSSEVPVPYDEQPAPPGTEDMGPGTYVEIRTIGQKGYILERPNAQGEVLVQVGILKLAVKQEDLVAIQSPEQEISRKKNNTFLEKARYISPEIDLRGLTADDAVLQVERYLEDAYLAGLEKVRIIHGKGTGALRKAIRDWLADYPRVRRFQDGDRQEGGAGVTVAYLQFGCRSD